MTIRTISEQPYAKEYAMTGMFYSRARRRIGLMASLALLASEAGTGRCALAETAAENQGGEVVPVSALPSLPVEGVMPSLDGAVAWLNSPPLDTRHLRGKVVLVDFWAYSCINCIRAEPYIRAWAEKYRNQGLVVIGVHTPEFSFETDIVNIRRAAERFGMTYPIAVDSNRAIWRAFDNEYWPALYFIDAQGRIRHHQFGEGEYDTSERVIRQLLAEAGAQAKTDTALVVPHARGAEAAADMGDIRSEETYIGYEKETGFASPRNIRRDRSATYASGNPGLNQWSLLGNWTVGAEHATLDGPGGAITYRFRARDLHLVLGPAAGGKPVRFQVLIDGVPPGADHGSDIDTAGKGIVTETRLYQLVRQSGAVRERTFQIRFLDPGVAAYSFTFG
ncbi:thioredoxin family protein [Gluconacetobacter tumulisoli]|uniref:Thioredoxin family protein n=1 Tax=Gluconacetobacter tumulisoli TaxID=1286189 RepID=A0A7W4K5W4_9PROT|nr:thioredoxin family protein [Gluconacetobacter tumulisoli]MBB2200822.1 thioredoxin family protein [Gluconacetobacter tumulisoli]